MVYARLLPALHESNAHGLQMQPLNTFRSSNGHSLHSSVIIITLKQQQYSSANTLNNNRCLLADIVRLHFDYAVHIQIHKNHEEKSRELHNQRSDRDHHAFVRVSTALAAYVLVRHLHAAISLPNLVLADRHDVALFVLMLVLLDAAGGRSALPDAGQNIQAG